MTRDQMIGWLQPWEGEDGKIAAQLQADGETIARLEAECGALHERLEDNRVYDTAGNRVDVEPGSIVDGIECRDESIKILDGNVERLRARIAELEASLTELLRISEADHCPTSEWKAANRRARTALRPADKGDAR